MCKKFRPLLAKSVSRGSHWKMEENKSVLPGNHARGWNDPPQFLYDAQKKSSDINPDNPLLSNKRVAHNISTQSGASNSNGYPQEHATAITSGLLNASANHVPILNMPQEASQESTTPEPTVELPEITDDAEMCQYCVNCFRKCSDMLKEEKKLSDKLATDVLKRISIFEKLWKSKMSSEAKTKCLKFGRALELGAFSAANSAHLQLMTDHVSEVSQWMVGIKKLIQAGTEQSVPA